MHFDEAVDRVNLDALTVEESDQLVQLCQESAEAHRLMGEQEQALTVYNALLGFLRSRGWHDKVAQVEFMLKQVQNNPMPARPVTPPPAGMPPSPQPATASQQGSTTRVVPPEQMASMQQPPSMPPTSMPGAAGMDYTMGAAPNMQQPAPVSPTYNGNPAGPQGLDSSRSYMPQSAASAQPVSPMPPAANNPLGELPDWLTGILNDADKTQIAHKQSSTPQTESVIANQPTTEQPIAAASDSASLVASETTVMKPPSSSSPASPEASEEFPASPSWLTEGAKPADAQSSQAPEMSVATPSRAASIPAPQTAPVPEESPEKTVAATQGGDEPGPDGSQSPASRADRSTQPEEAETPETPAPVIPVPANSSSVESKDAPIATSTPEQKSRKRGKKSSAEELLSEIAGSAGKDEALKQVADAVLASTASLPENIRMQVVQSLQDIQRYIDHGLLSPATEECLRVIDMAPQYLDIHQVLCEIYVRQGKIEQAITKYAILIDTYVVNGRSDDAIATYRRILQLEPNNLTYRVRLISLLASQGNKEDLLRERTLAAESYLRLGYMDRALTELEQALQDSPTSVPTRLNYALALQKLGRTQQAVAEYQRVLQVDPRNITALVRWHIAMITGIGTARATTLEVLSRIRWQLRGEGQKHYESVVREYTAAAETYPNNADIHFAIGQIHQQAGNFDKAIDAYSLARRDSSYEVLARVSSAQCLLTQGKLEAAISQLEQALQSVRRSPAGSVDPSVWAARPREDGEEHQAPEVEISMVLATVYGRAGRPEQMQAILRQVKQKTPYQDEVSSALAEISARQGDIDSALQEYFDLVRHYRSKRQVDNALSVLNEMVRMAPQDPRAHGELADIYISRGLLDEGIAELRLLADIHLRNDSLEQAAEAFRRIGNIYAEMGDTEEAFTNLRRAAELAPDDLDLLREVVGYCCQIGRTKEAVEYQAVIARHYYDTHQVKESVAALQQLIALNRNSYEAYDMLGQTYQSVGEYEQASRVYKNLARVNPESAIARERLSTLQELRARSV
jgi:tetratricopeptide (TPR) repeat protein